MTYDESGMSRWPVGRIDAHAACRGTLAAALVVIAVHLTFGIVHAEVATVEDAAACNQEARERLPGRTASPTPRDEAGAENARKAQATVDVTRSPDPQIDGMHGEGAKDAAYRATYRGCMRKKGF